MKITKSFLVVVLVLTIISLVGCSAGISEGERTAAKNSWSNIQEEWKNVWDKYNNFTNQFQPSPEYRDFYGFYAERENWKSQIEAAGQELEKAEAVYQNITSLLKADKKDQTPKLLEYLQQVEGFVQNAHSLAEYPAARREFIDSVRVNHRQVIDTAVRNLAALNNAFAAVQAASDKARVEYASQTDYINQHFEPIKKLTEDSQVAFKLAAEQSDLVRAGKFTDFAVLGDQAQIVNINSATGVQQANDLQGQIGSLFHSYSKTLMDMRVDYSILIKRSSWNDDDEGSRDFTYPPVAISNEIAEYIDKLPENLDYIAHLQRNGGNSDEMKYKIDEGIWNQLGIAPRESWPEKDREAEFYIQDMPGKYFHKYLIIQNEQVTETDWQEVSEDFFDDYVDDLGMEIESKPYGVLKDQTIKEESPPGMSFVGNDKYGQWKTDDQGQQFWVFYVQYLMLQNLLGPNRYYYGEWNTWNSQYRGRQPYYGKTDDQKQRYGTHGSVTANSSRFSASSTRARNFATRFGSTGGGSRGFGAGHGK